MPALLELLAAELEKPRLLPPQIAKHLAGTYGVSLDGIGEFLLNELPKLEDYEVDLVLSPAFTPTLEEQAVFAEHLGRETVPPEQWPPLVAALTARPTRAQLLAETRQPVEATLRDVTIERYVHRLRLQGTIQGDLFQRIEALSPATDRPLLKAIARRAVWSAPARSEVLARFLANSSAETRASEGVALLNLVETYEPADAAELLARLPHWQHVLRHEISQASGPKPFFNERVEELHGGGRDQRRTEDSRVLAKQHEAEFLDRLPALLAT
jgi:hypothetical protein